MRAVLIVEDLGGNKWKILGRVADRGVDQLEPVTGAGDVNQLEAWFNAGWRVHSGSGLSTSRATVAEGDPISARRAQLRPRDPDRLVIVLEHSDKK